MDDIKSHQERHEIVLRQHRERVTEVIEHLNELNDALEKLVYEDLEGLRKYVTTLSENKKQFTRKDNYYIK